MPRSVHEFFEELMKDDPEFRRLVKEEEDKLQAEIEKDNVTSNIVQESKIENED